MVVGIDARGSGVLPKVRALEGINELGIADGGAARSIGRGAKEGRGKREGEGRLGGTGSGDCGIKSSAIREPEDDGDDGDEGDEGDEGNKRAVWSYRIPMAT